MIVASVLLNCAAQLLIRKGMLQVGQMDMGYGWHADSHWGTRHQPVAVGCHVVLCAEHTAMDGSAVARGSWICLSVPEYRICGGSRRRLLFLGRKPFCQPHSGHYRHLYRSCLNIKELI